MEKLSILTCIVYALGGGVEPPRGKLPLHPPPPLDETRWTHIYTVTPLYIKSIQVPAFVGNDYFCATGNPGPGFITTKIYSEDPLWDGEGCGPTNACCQFNNPPWFCTTLPKPTTDDLELRICRDQSWEDSLVDISVM